MPTCHHFFPSSQADGSFFVGAGRQAFTVARWRCASGASIARSIHCHLGEDAPCLRLQMCAHAEIPTVEEEMKEGALEDRS